MPTVDDLSISLTIKDNSNLDKLRKNLDAIIKTGGIGAGGVGATPNKDLSKIKNAVYGIEQQMNYLIPTVAPPATDVAGMKEYGRRVSANLETFKASIASYLTPEKLGALQDLARDLNIEDVNVENMQSGVEKLLDKYNVLAQSIAKGELVMRAGKAKAYLDLVSNVIKNIQGKGGLTQLREIEKAIPEDIMQRTLEILMDKAGITKQGQFQMFQIKDKFSRQESKKLDEWIGKLDKDVIDKFKPMFEDTDVWTGLMYAMKELDFKPEDLADIFSDITKIEGNEEIRNLIKFLVSQKKGGGLDFLALPRSFRDLAKKEAGVKLRRPGKGGMTVLDINAFSGDVDKLRELIPTLSETTEKLIEEIGVIPMELKNWLTVGSEGNLELQSKIFGPNLTVVASMISKQALADLERWKVQSFTVPFFTDLMIEAGLTTPAQTKEDLLEAMEGIAKELNMEEIQKAVDSIDKKMEGISSHEDMRALMGEISDLYDKILNKPSLPGDF